MHSDKPPRLSLIERLVALSIIQLFLVISIVVYNNSYEEESVILHETKSPEPSSTISVTITGAVNYPGEYTLSKGITIKEALDYVKPLPQARLSHLKTNSKILKNKKIEIKEYQRMPKKKFQ